MNAEENVSMLIYFLTFFYNIKMHLMGNINVYKIYCKYMQLPCSRQVEQQLSTVNVEIIYLICI